MSAESRLQCGCAEKSAGQKQEGGKAVLLHMTEAISLRGTKTVLLIFAAAIIDD